MAQQKLVRLFYLGGLAPDEKAHPVSVGTRVFRLPPIGEYIEVTQFQASELMAKYKNFTPNGVYDAFSTDARIGATAKAVKEGRVVTPPKSADAMSNDELLALLRARGMEVAPAASTPEPELEEPFSEAQSAVEEAELLAAPVKKTRGSKTASQE